MIKGLGYIVCSLHTGGVTGSIPVAPTISSRSIEIISHFSDIPLGKYRCVRQYPPVKTVVLSPAAARALDKIDEADRSAITDAIYAYALGRPSNTKALVGTPTVRMRIGDFRAIFDETETMITVLAVGNRRDIYR